MGDQYQAARAVREARAAGRGELGVLDALTELGAAGNRAALSALHDRTRRRGLQGRLCRDALHTIAASDAPGASIAQRIIAAGLRWEAWPRDADAIRADREAMAARDALEAGQ